MEALETILTRRSIRSYTAQPVPAELVQCLLEAAMSAPSASNEQAWQFVVISDRCLLDEIPKLHPYAEMLKQAPLAILVCGDLHQEHHRDYWVQDCSAATENLLLAAHASGLGAVWLGVYPDEDRVVKIRKLLGIPDDVTPMALISIGYPAEHVEPAHRYDPAKVHTNHW